MHPWSVWDNALFFMTVMFVVGLYSFIVMYLVHLLKCWGHTPYDDHFDDEDKTQPNGDVLNDGKWN